MAPAITFGSPAPSSDGGATGQRRSRHGARRRRATVRAALALALPWLVVVVAGISLLRWKSVELQGLLATGGSSLEQFLQPLWAWRARQASAQVPSVVLFGDSVMFEVPPRLDERLRSGGAAVETVGVTAALLRPIHDLYLLDEVLAGHPSVVVVEVNLAWLEPPAGLIPPTWLQRLSRFLSPARTPRVLEAALREQASLLDPWLFRFEEKLGLLYAADGARQGARLLVTGAQSASEEALDLRPVPPVRDHGPPPWVKEAYGADVLASPNVAVLREIARGVRSGGADVLFFVAPVNEIKLAQLRIPAPADLAERSEALRLAVGARPEEWLDLHALVPPDEFRDMIGHLKDPGTERLSDTLAAATRARLGARR